MPNITKLSEIALEIDRIVRNGLNGKTFWIIAEISSVRKEPHLKRCYLDFTQTDENGTILFKGICWPENYGTIELFESSTGSEFRNGIEVTCKVCVTFYKNKTCANLKLLEIDSAYTIGTLELERQKNLKKLVKENISIKLLSDGSYKTRNRDLKLPLVIQKIALITARNSDGLRDFNTINQNKYGYKILISEYLTQVQGNNANLSIIEKLNQIEPQKNNYDAVVICRGGGSDNDLAVFNDYELSRRVALFPIPILTGIGHHRNFNIVDLMANKSHSVPLEVARFIIDRNKDFEIKIQELKNSFFLAVDNTLTDFTINLSEYKRRVKSLNPETILKRGFAIIKCNEKIVTDGKSLKINSEIQMILKNDIIFSKVFKKIKK